MHFLLSLALIAADLQGLVRFGGQPVPGASVTAASASGQKHSTITNLQGVYRFTELPEGSSWDVKVEMQLFAPQSKTIQLPVASVDASTFDLQPVPLDQMGPLTKPKQTFERTETTVSQTAKPAAADPAKPQSAQAAQGNPSQPAVDELAQRAADGFLINGSVNNGAASPFAQLPAFGNNRRGQRGLYNGNIGVILNNSTFDARNYSLTGQLSPKPDYNRMQALVSLGGPIRIPGLTKRNNGPSFTVNYQWTRNSNASIATGLMPTAEQRAGATSPQARELLKLFPMPNFSGSDRFNYQVPLVSGYHQDDLQTRANKQIRRNFFSGNYSWQSTRTDSPSIFGFLDTGRVSGINSGFSYRRTFNQRTFITTGVSYSRLTNRVTPYFSNRENVSANAGITGNNQEAINWGPPNLIFANGISALMSSQASLIRNQTAGLNVDAFMSRGRHNIMYGYSHKRQQFNVLSQQDARGTFAFTSDFSNFLNGIPDTSSIAFGNADKYLRSTINEGYVNDDYRVNPSLTINAGVRWEYWSPATEKYGRLVNLDVSQNFSRATPVVGDTLKPDRNNFSPRIAFSWRPLIASSMVIRGGYGIYYDTSVYQPIAMQMAQQAPLSKSLRISNTPVTPITLANGFNAGGASATSATTFGVDPYLRVGYSQNWQTSIQRDLPAGLQMTASYSGSKGTRGQQQFLPNTFPTGAIDPSGFTYLVSNGNSIRHAGQLQLRRRLRSGLTASMNYTYAKSIDNAALGGRSGGNSGAGSGSSGGGTSGGGGGGASPPLTAQNWLDLSAERARSNFDQRHLLTGAMQYTTGMGLRGGALANGWKAKFLKEWTLGSMFTVGTGLPLTPVYLSPVRGTGVTGSIRPDYTGAPQFDDRGILNPLAYAIPVAGNWGNAGRNSITGPKQFVVNASLGRTFRATERISTDFRLEANNVLNYVTFPSWNTVIGNTQFGLPNSANAMRSVQAIFRMRF
jgi:uncharacterized membrane protein YgcG